MVKIWHKDPDIREMVEDLYFLENRKFLCDLKLQYGDKKIAGEDADEQSKECARIINLIIGKLNDRGAYLVEKYPRILPDTEQRYLIPIVTIADLD